MKNIKSITLGILIGATATISITALAEYIVVPNSFPVKVNGQTVQVEGYNINDSTYFKLRDVADAVGGFEVGFEDNAIIVNTPNKPTPAPIPTTTAAPVSSVKPTPNPKLGQEELEYRATLKNQEYSSDGLPIIDSYQDGKRYINTRHIDMVYDIKEHGYTWGPNYLRDEQHNKLIDNMVVSELYDIELNYYETVLRPCLQEYCK